MLYPNARKIFETCLGGRHLTEDEEKEVESLLKSMEGAGWLVEESSSAPFVTIVAFFYARAPKTPDLAAVTMQLSKSLDETTKSALVVLADKAKPVIHLDFIKTFKDTLKEVITVTSLITFGVCIALTGYAVHSFYQSHPVPVKQSEIQPTRYHA